MAKYTVELNDIVKSKMKVFNFDYTFYDDAQKPDFEQKFINHFLFREIGVETVGRFQHYLKCKCDETLPFYNMLFRTALIDYQKTINYNLTETLVREVGKTDSVTGNAVVDGTNKVTETKTDTVTASGSTTDANTTTNNNTLTHEGGASANGNKTNTLNSSTDHTETVAFTKVDNVVESGSIDTTTTVDIANKKVGSDTPNGLLAMADIETNVYASKADIENNSNETEQGQNSNSSKSGDSTESTTRTTNDTIHATNTDVSSDTTSETATDTNSGSVHSNGSGTTSGTSTTSEASEVNGIVGNTTATTQNATGSENETSTRIMRGSYGVITEADMLKKHIELQQTLSTILSKFFDECEDLFMQIF